MIRWTMAESPADDVVRILENTRAVRWWIDEQIRKGRSDDEIVREAPFAVAFITGQMSYAELEAALTP